MCDFQALFIFQSSDDCNVDKAVKSFKFILLGFVVKRLLNSCSISLQQVDSETKSSEMEKKDSTEVGL